MTYQDVIDTYGSYQDFEAAFPNYKAAGTSLIQDASPCNNDGGYSGSVDTTILPLISGETYAMIIDNNNSIAVFTDNDYSELPAAGGLATKYHSDSDFSLETWFYPMFTTDALTPIIGDATNNVGLFYDNGNITFSVDTESITYTLPYLNKAIYIVASYTGESIALYVNGVLVNNKSLNSFKFTNESASLSVGPTSSSADAFLVNGIAAYRYALTLEQIQAHYIAAQTIDSEQIVKPEYGQLFNIYDNNITKQYKYSYPANRPWVTLLTADLYYNEVENAIEIPQTTTAQSKTVIIEDFLTIPLAADMNSSKIDWDGNNGITVETSLDGVTYTQCTNGLSIPGYTINSFDSSRIVYLRITMHTEDASKYIPRLDNLSLTFYNNQSIYSVNSPAKLYELSGVSNAEMTLGNKFYPILSRDDRNGVRVSSGSGFNISTNRSTGTIEFFYTPSSLSSSGLISEAGGTKYSWTSSISKSNINSIHVNGVNKTSQTNIANVFKVGQLHHVVITLTTAITGPIKFNYSSAGSVSALYQNIALYENQFTSNMAVDNYIMYTNGSVITADDSSLTLTENGVSVYNNDWLVIQNV
jgi:hypothetical protein